MYKCIFSIFLLQPPTYSRIGRLKHLLAKRGKMARSTQAYGLGDPLQQVFPQPVVSTRAPASTDTKYPIGQNWVNKSTDTVYALSSVAAGSATWTALGGGSSAVGDLDGDSGTATPSGGTITIAGGTNMTTAAASATVTVNMDAAISLATSVTSPLYTTDAADMDITAASGQDIDITMGDAAGANFVSFLSSTPAEVGSIDSTGAMSALSYATSAAAAGLTISGSDIDADGSDADISITLTPKGTGDVVVDLGDIQNTSGDIIVTHSSAGADVTLESTNSDNTDPASRAGVELAVGGTSAGDPYANFLISGGQAFTMGIDNSSTNDDFVISNSSALGTTDRVVIDGSTGVVTLSDGLTSGGVTLINDSVNANTSINTGTSTGTISVGNAAAGAITVDTAAGISLDAATASNFTCSLAASAAAITISASAADGGITLDAGANPGVTFTNGTQSHQMLVGTGSPNGSITASQGSMYVDVGGSTSTTILFVNTDGSTTWVGVGA